MLPNSDRRPEIVRVSVLVLLGLALFFFRLGERPLWDVDEGMHAATSKEMVESGDWISPRLNGEPFYDKPPLFNWLVALALSNLGFTEFAARLPAAILGLATVLATYRFGRRMIGPEASFLGAVVLASSVLFFALSRVVVHDISLAFFVSLALFAFYRAYACERRRGAQLALAYAAIGFAVLAKGPLGAVLPAGVVLVFLAIRRELGFVRQMMPVRGALLATAIGVPWYAIISFEDPGYLPYFLVEKNLGTYLAAESLNEAVTYYVPLLLAGFFPWSFLLPLALWRLLRRPATLEPARLFLLVWFGFVLVFFTAASHKLPTYVLPLFPAVALLLGDLWSQLFASPAARLSRGLVLAHLGMLGVVGWILVKLWTSLREYRLFDPEVHLPHLIAVTAFLASTVAAASYFLWTRRHRASFATVAASMVVLVLYLAVSLLPLMDPYKSTKDLALRLDRLLAPGEEMTFYHDLKDSALFYTDRRANLLLTPWELREHFRREGSLCVVDDKWWKEVEILGSHFRVVDRGANKLILEGVGAGTAPSATARRMGLREGGDVIARVGPVHGPAGETTPAVTSSGWTSSSVR